jgi:hypothetical protein
MGILLQSDAMSATIFSVGRIVNNSGWDKQEEWVVRLLLFVPMVGLLWLSGLAYAESPVYFPDDKLKAAVEDALWISDPTPEDMLALTDLQCPSHGEIRSLTGLQYATNLESLSLLSNLVVDISVLSGLVNLRTLILEGNRITDISALSGLTELQELNLRQNRISDISVLSGLINLRTLSIHRNEVSDLSPLTALTCLKWLDLRVNPLNAKAFETDIEQIRANNPGIWIGCDPTYGRHLVISSTAGGAVVCPGEGEFVYEYNQVVSLEAIPDPGFVFLKWSGDFSSTANPLSITVVQDHDVLASFQSLRDTLYVNQGTSRGLPADGTAENPFSSIQEAMDVARDGVTIFVAAGVYRENLVFRGKSIRLKGFDPDSAPGGAWPVLDGAGEGPVLCITGATDGDCAVSGFVITGGKNASTSAISCSAGALTVANCLVVGNCSTNWNGGVVRCTGTDATFINCTIADNDSGEYGTGLCLVKGRLAVINSIVWANGSREIVVEQGAAPSIHYSTIGGGWPGPGNREDDPLFAGSGYWARPNNLKIKLRTMEPGAVWVMGDYHLKSQSGRWEPIAGQWVQDSVTSPCLDAGDPNSPIDREPSPNGGIINMGVYGGTAEASKSAVSY